MQTDNAKILDDIEKHLKETDDLMVPLKHLLFILEDHGMIADGAKLKLVINNDPRFHIEEPSSMVLLKEKKPTLDDIFSEIHKNLEQLSGTLSRAYFAAPESSEGGDQVLAMMHEVETLKYETSKLLDKAKQRHE